MEVENVNQTSIQITKSVLAGLYRYKKKNHFRTYDDALRQLLNLEPRRKLSDKIEEIAEIETEINPPVIVVPKGYDKKLDEIFREYENGKT